MPDSVTFLASNAIQTFEQARKLPTALTGNLVKYVELIAGVSPLGEAYMRHAVVGEQRLGQDRVAQGVPKHCFMNAARLAIREPSRWIYVEGLACSEDIPIPLEHAWVLDTETLEIVDNTWEGQRLCAYLGIPFYSEWLYVHLRKTHRFGVFATGLRTRSMDKFREAVHPAWR